MTYIQLIYEGVKKYLRKSFSTNYKIWNEIVNDNKIEISRRGFLINKINELGIIISLSEEEVNDLNFIKNPLKFEHVKYEVFQNKLISFLNSQNEYFLQIGLREIIDDDYEIEISDISQFVYYVSFTFKLGKLNWKFYISMLAIILLTFIFFKL